MGHRDTGTYLGFIRPSISRSRSSHPALKPDTDANKATHFPTNKCGSSEYVAHHHRYSKRPQATDARMPVNPIHKPRAPVPIFRIRYLRAFTVYEHEQVFQGTKCKLPLGSEYITAQLEHEGVSCACFPLGLYGSITLNNVGIAKHTMKSKHSGATVVQWQGAQRSNVSKVNV